MQCEDTETHREKIESHVITGPEAGGVQLQARVAKDVWQPPEAKREAGSRPSPRAFSRNSFVNTVISDLRPPEL